VYFIIGMRFSFTNLIQHLIALIKDEDLDIPKPKFLLSDQGVQSAGCRNDDVGVGVLISQGFDILLHRRSAVEDCRLDLRKVLAEACVLILNLVCQLAGVAHNKDGALARYWLDLLERREDEDCSLPKPGLGLAKNIRS